MPRVILLLSFFQTLHFRFELCKQAYLTCQKGEPLTLDSLSSSDGWPPQDCEVVLIFCCARSLPRTFAASRGRPTSENVLELLNAHSYFFAGCMAIQSPPESPFWSTRRSSILPTARSNCFPRIFPRRGMCSFFKHVHPSSLRFELSPAHFRVWSKKYPIRIRTNVRKLVTSPTSNGGGNDSGSTKQVVLEPASEDGIEGSSDPAEAKDSSSKVRVKVNCSDILLLMHLFFTTLGVES